MSDDKTGELLFYVAKAGDAAMSVRLAGQTVWLSLDQMATLFQRDKSTISRHISNVFAEGELPAVEVVADFATTAADGKTYQVRHYNLDVVISVGYRVKSLRGTQFRRWATTRLNEFLVKGFTLDDARLKDAGGGAYWRELLARIRDIRSSEKVLYRQVLDLYATSVDYDPRSPASRDFFKVVQNKLHYAAHGHTAAEVIRSRADAGRPFMGLLTFGGERPTKADTEIAKNYLDASELQRLNTLVSAYFDAAEFRAMSHEPTYMADWLGHLDRLMVAMDAAVLDGPGTVSHEAAITHAAAEYERYRQITRAEPSAVEVAYFDQLRAERKRLEGR